MTVKSITAAILKEAKDEVQTLLEQAQQDAGKLTAEHAETLAAERAQKEAAYEKEAEKLYGTEMVKANFTIRNEELQSRQALIDKAFDKAIGQLRAASKEERKKILASLLKNANAQMQVSTIHVSSQDKGLVPAKYKVKTADIKGGLIAETKDGDVRIDLSYEAILADIKESYVERFSAGLEG